MPFIPFFSDTIDNRPDFELAWRRHGRNCKFDKRLAQREYLRNVRENRLNNGSRELSMSETEMKTYGYIDTTTPDELRGIIEDDYITGRKPTLRYDKYRVNPNRKLEDDDLTNRIDKIRNSTAPRKVKRSKPYLDQEAERGLSRTRTDRQTDSGGLGINMIIAFVGIAIMLMIGILIFSEVSDAVDPRYMNATSGYPVQPLTDPLEMLLAPFEIITDTLGVPIWAILPLIIGVALLMMKGMSRAL